MLPKGGKFGGKFERGGTFFEKNPGHPSQFCFVFWSFALFGPCLFFSAEACRPALPGLLPAFSFALYRPYR
jgi:hypothetical protein